MSEDMPDRFSEDIPDRMSEDMTDRMSEDMPHRMPDRMSEDIPDRMSEDMTDKMSEDMPGRMSEDIPDRMSEDMTDKMSKDMPDRMSEDIPDRMPDRMSEDMKICQIECQKIFQIECRKICQIEWQKIWQIECQKICQIESQTECQIECQKICQIECQMGWIECHGGDHSKQSIFLQNGLSGLIEKVWHAVEQGMTSVAWKLNSLVWCQTNSSTLEALTVDKFLAAHRPLSFPLSETRFSLGPVGRLDAQSGRCRLEAVVSCAEWFDWKCLKCCWAGSD